MVDPPAGFSVNARATELRIYRGKILATPAIHSNRTFAYLHTRASVA
jgi:hypothetical protein